MKEAEARARQIFSTEHDLKKFRARVAGDSLMSRLEAEHRGLHIARWPSVFEALVISILSQQISTAVAMTLKRRVVEKYGERLAIGEEIFLAFPTAEALAGAAPHELRALGLSGSKVTAVMELAQKARDGELDEGVLERDDNEALINRLTTLRGIGRWTAEWALMLHFGRTDVFPAGDLALRGFVVKYYNDGAAMPEREIRALANSLLGRVGFLRLGLFSGGDARGDNQPAPVACYYQGGAGRVRRATLFLTSFGGRRIRRDEF